MQTCVVNSASRQRKGDSWEQKLILLERLSAAAVWHVWWTGAQLQEVGRGAASGSIISLISVPLPHTADRLLGAFQLTPQHHFLHLQTNVLSHRKCSFNSSIFWLHTLTVPVFLWNMTQTSRTLSHIIEAEKLDPVSSWSRVKRSRKKPHKWQN